MNAASDTPGFFDRVWTRKWLLVACLLVSIAATNIGLRFYPPRYRADTSILVVPGRVPDEYVHVSKTADLEKRMATIQQQILSRTRLERIINEYNLYAEERKTGIMEDVVQRTRDDISVQVVHDDIVRIGFEGSNPRTVQKVTERLASLFIEENLNDRAMLADSTNQFIEAQLDETRRLLDEQDTKITTGTKSGHSLSKAETIEYDALQQQYRDLLNKRQSAKMSANLERRQIGEQFKLLDAARIPEEPIAPNKMAARTGGAVAGLGLGVVLIGFISRRRHPSASQIRRGRRVIEQMRQGTPE